MDYEEKIKALEEELQSTKQELQATKDHLKKYTAPSYKKEYYEKNKEKILEKMRFNPTPIDKRQEYNRISYLRRKEKEKQKQKQKQQDI
jgi:hypothetical protein